MHPSMLLHYCGLHVHTGILWNTIVMLHIMEGTFNCPYKGYSQCTLRGLPEVSLWGLKSYVSVTILITQL